MSDQHHYEIDIKQGDLVINLSSDDVYFISKQMDKWFKVLLDDSYVPIPIPPAPVAKPVEPVAPAEPEPIVLPEPEPVVVAPEPPPAPLAVPPLPPVQEVSLPPEPKPEPVLPPSPPPPPAPPVMPEPIVQAPPLPEPVLPIPPAPAPAIPIAEPVPAEKLDSAVQDDFEAVMDTLMRDLEKGENAPYQATSATLPQAAPLPAPPSVVDLSDVDTLSELADRSKAASAEDYLMLTSYYIVCIEGSDDKFSLKRINSHLVKSGMTPVNHSVLESVITKNYLTLVPDLTGLADISEYSLSDAGQAYVLKLFT